MNGLYKRVLKGVYPPINQKYSKDLASAVGMMLIVDHKQRPSCDEILSQEFIRSRANRLGIDLDEGFVQEKYEEFAIEKQSDDVFSDVKN